MQRIAYNLIPQDVDGLFHVTFIGNAYVKKFTNSAVTIVGIFQYTAVDGAVRDDDTLVLRGTDDGMPQCDLLNGAGYIVIPYKIPNDKGLYGIYYIYTLIYYIPYLKYK